MGNPLKGILGSARKMGLDPMAMAANAVGQGNPMLGQLMKFATQYKGKSPNELKNLVVSEIQKAGGITQDQLDGMINMAKRYGVNDSQIKEATSLLEQHPDLLKK